MIDLDAVAGNWRRLAERVAPAACAGLLKADAYGLGADLIAPTLAAAGCERFFVAHIDEAIQLRELLAQHPIYVLNGLLPGTESEFLRHDLVPVLNDLGQIARWALTAHDLERPLAALLQVDTGMARLGLPPYEVDELAANPDLLDGIELEWVMSHLACADEPDHAHNRVQLAAFRDALGKLPAAKASLANSSGIFLGQDFHFDLARPGYAVYGGNPTPGSVNPMSPVVDLKAKIIQVRTVEAGDAVGYGATWRAGRETRVATVPLGYADGYLRSLSSSGTAWIDGEAVPVIGRVSMDLVTLDVTAIPEDRARVGRMVDLVVGPDGLDRLAEEAGTIGYEVLTALGGRYPRRYLGGPLQ